MISFGMNPYYPVVSSIKIEDAYNMIKKKLFQHSIEMVKEGKREKHSLPFFSGATFRKYIGMNGKIYDGFASNYFVKYNQYMIFDLDKCDDVDKTYDYLTTIPCCRMAFRSPSGRGIKMFCRLPETIYNKHLFTASYKEYLLWFEQEHGLIFDSATVDPRRLCFVSSDENAFLNIKSENLPLVVPEAEEIYPVKEEIHEITDEMIEVVKEGQKGYDDWLKIAFSLCGVDGGRDIFARISDKKDALARFDKLKKSHNGDITVGTFFWYYNKFKGEDNDSANAR